MANVNLQAVITARDEASRVMKGFAGSIKGAEQGSKMFAKALLGVGIAATAFAVKSVKAYQAQENAEARLVAGLKNVKTASDSNIDSLLSQASALQRVTRFGNEQIISAQGVLSTFQMNQKQIETLTPRLIDMAEGVRKATGETVDLEQISIAMGKVMSGNIGSLKRYGVVMTDAEEATFKAASETERAAILAKILDNNYRGMGEAAGQTLAGQMDIASNAIGDFMKEIGKLISNAIKPLIKKFTEWWDSVGGATGAMDLLRDKLSWITNNWQIIVAAIVGGLIPAFVAWGAAIWTAMFPLLKFIIIGAAIGLVIKAIINHFGGWQALMEKLQPTINVLKKAWEEIGKVWESLIKPALIMLWNIIKSQLVPVLQELWGRLKELWQQLKPILLPVLKAIAVIIGVGLLVAVVTIIAAITGLILVITAIVKVISVWIDIIKKVWEAWKQLAIIMIDAIKRAINWAKDKWENFKNWLRNLWDRIKTDIQSKWNSMVNWFRGIPNRIWNAIKGVGDKIKAPFVDAIQAIKDFWNRNIGGKGITIPSWVPGVGGKSFSVPTWQAGGIVPETGLAYLHKGEMVKPQGSFARTGDITVNITGPVNMASNADVDAVAKRLARSLQLARQGAY